MTNGACTGEVSYHKPVEYARKFCQTPELPLAGDRGQMARVYGGSGIPLYWIINLIDRQVEVYSSPVGGVYPPPTIIRESQSVTLTLGDQPISPIAVADLLPKGV